MYKKSANKLLIPFFKEDGFKVAIEPEGYCFSKKMLSNICKVYIYFPYIDCVRMSFGVRVSGSKQIQAQDFATTEEYPCDEIGNCNFSNIDELEKIFECFTLVVKKYSYSIFKEIIDTAPAFNPPEMNQLEIVLSARQIFFEYVEAKGIDGDDLSALMDALVDDITYFIEFTAELEKKQMIMLAAVFGQIMIKRFGGEWKYNKEINLCYIDAICGSTMRSYPVSSITYCIREKKPNSVYEDIQKVSDRFGD